MREFSKAGPLYQRFLEINEKAYGPNHPYVTNSLEYLAQWYLNEREYAKAEPLYQRALKINEKTFGLVHPEVAWSLDGLARLYEKIREYAKAEPLLQRALEIKEKTFGPDHLDVAKSLAKLAELYEKMGEYAKAEPLHQRILKINEKTLGSNHPDMATYLLNLGLLYGRIGSYAKAVPLYQRSLEIVEENFGPNHPFLHNFLYNLASFYYANGEYAKAEPLYQRIVNINEEAIDPGDPNVAGSLGDLAGLYETIGSYDKAESIYQRALKISEKALGPEHPDVVISSNNLAMFFRNMGEYAKAESLYQRALKISEEAFGPKHPDVAISLNTLAVLYHEMGDYPKAEPLYRRALKISEEAFGPEHLDVVISLNNLAWLYKTMGEYAKAESLYQRSLEISEKASGLGHPNVATSLNNLAWFFQGMEEYVKAEPLYQRALKINEEAFGPEHPHVAGSLDNLAFLYSDIGEFEKAESLIQRALKIREKAFGPEHLDVGNYFISLALLDATRQNYQSALEYFKKGLLIQERQIQNIFIIATEKQKLNFIQNFSGDYEACLSLIHQQFITEQDAVQYGLELVLSRKGVVFDAQSRARESMQGRLSESAMKDWEKLSSLRGNLSRLLLSKPEEISYEDYRNTIASLQQQIEEVEKNLSRESALVAKELEQRKVTVEGVSKILPENSALIEFVLINDYDFTGRKRTSLWRYLAFILLPDGEVELIDLGRASELYSDARRVIENIRVSIESSNIKTIKQSQLSLDTLYTKVWDPLEESLKGVDKVLVSPDGVFNLVQFAALIDGNGRFLIERYSIAYVTSGRELIGGDNEPILPESELLLVANPAYDIEVSVSPIQVASTRSREFRGVFNPLPGTALEAKEIPTLVTGREDRKSVLEGLDATEGAVKAARSPRILHLATHGFFLADLEIPLDEGRRGLSSIVLYENPLVRSGLAFAGANHASEITEGDDGILTALEISGMDLYGTDLVVLSACETGVGEIQIGEGVFGLRRAFALSGAKNLLMSLWPVSDKATVKQMVLFYKNLREMPPAEALRQAQLETIKELEDELGIAPPMLWAPFILQGAQAFGKGE